MKNIVVIGGSGHAKVVISILKRLKNYNLTGYLDKQDNGEILGVQYLGSDYILKELKEKKVAEAVVIGIGQLQDPIPRYNLIQKIISFGLPAPPIIAPTAIINEDVAIGDGTVVMDGVTINTGTKIGKFSIINTQSSVDHDCRIGDYTHLAPGVILSGGVEIGDMSLIGTAATVIHYCKISKRCVIGAGAVVVEDCESSGTYVGNPAKKIHG